MSTIKVRRGLKNNLPASATAGELLFTMDSKEFIIGNGAGIPNTVLVRKNNYAATTPPAVSNDSSQSYSVGSIWVDITNKKYYSCVDATAGAAIWVNCTSTSFVTGDLTESTSAVLTITRGIGAVVGTGTSIQVKQASSTQAGYLSSANWTTFNGKQDPLGFTPENVLNRNIPGGYATLDTNTMLVQNVDASKITSGIIGIARLPQGALERLTVVANQTARFALTTNNVQNGDTVKQADSGVMYYVSDDTNLNNSSGYQIYAAGSAATVPWSGVTSTPTTLSGYGIGDAAPLSHVGTGGTAHAVVTTSSNGFMSSADKLKLDNIASGATKVEASLTNGNIKVNGSELVVYTEPKNNFSATTAPTVSNDSSQGYSVGSQWIDTITDSFYVCANNSVGAAVWILSAAVSAAATPRSYVNGCRLIWLSTTTLAIQTGAINLAGVTYELTARVSMGWANVATGTTKTANTWYYVYLKSVAGVLTPYISTAVPNQDAFGNALTLPTDSVSKYNSSWGRFIGSFKTDASQNITDFIVSGNLVSYRGLGYAFFLSGGSANSKTAVNCRAYIPYTSNMGNIYIYDGSSSGNKYVGDVNSWTWQSTQVLGGVECMVPITNNSVYYQSGSQTISLGVHGYMEEI